MSHTSDSLSALGRKEIQAIAKTLGLKANAATAVLIEQIVSAQPPVVSVSELAAEVAIPIEVYKNTPVPTFETEEINAKSTTTASSSTSTTVPSLPPATTNNNDSTYQIGSNVEVNIDCNWLFATIVKLNKKSVRVKLNDNNDEKTINFNLIRMRQETSSSSTQFSSSSGSVTSITPVEEYASVNDDITVPKNFIKSIKAELECKLIIESAKVPLRKSLLSKPENKHEVMEPVVHPASNEWAMSMESCLHEMVNKKAAFKKNQSAEDSAPKRNSKTKNSLENIVQHKVTEEVVTAPELAPKRNSKSKVIIESAVDTVIAMEVEESVPKRSSRSKSAQNELSIEIAVDTKTSSSSSDESHNVPIIALSKKRKDQDTKPSQLSGMKRFKMEQEPIQMSASKGSSFKKAPDFNKIHARQYSASKPITSVVDRKQSIAVNMTEAFEEAKKNGFSSKLINNSTSSSSSSSSTILQPVKEGATKPSLSNINSISSTSNNTKKNGGLTSTISSKIAPMRSNIATSVKAFENIGAITSTSSVATTKDDDESNVVFKAKPMPNFNKIHSSLKIVTTGLSKSTNTTPNVNTSVASIGRPLSAIHSDNQNKENSNVSNKNKTTLFKGMPNSQQKLTGRHDKFTNHLSDKRNTMLQLARNQLKTSASLLDSTNTNIAKNVIPVTKNVLQPMNVNKVPGPFSMNDFNE